jgi:hypothetical protein
MISVDMTKQHRCAVIGCEPHALAGLFFLRRLGARSAVQTVAASSA